MKRKLIVVVGIATLILLMSGCVLTRPPKSKIPHFLLKLNHHSFTDPEKETIGEILNYVNDLEHSRKR